MPWGKYPPGKGCSFGNLRKQKGAWRCFGRITIQANYAIDGPKVLGPKVFKPIQMVHGHRRGPKLLSLLKHE